MKRLFYAGLFLMGFSPLAHAQKHVGSIQPIIDKGMHLVHRIEEKDPKSEILKLEFDLAHDDNYTTVDLKKGTEYVFGAFGDDRVEELTIIVLEETKPGVHKEILKRDLGSDNATIRFVAPLTGHYAVDVQINKLADEHEVGHYGLIVCEILK